MTTEQVDEAAKLIEDILINAAQLCLRKKKNLVNPRSPPGNDGLMKNCILNLELLITQLKYYLTNHLIKIVRNSYFKHYMEYRKLLKLKKNNVKQNTEQLDELETKDPKQYWKLANSLKDDDNQTSGPELGIDSDSWSDYFQNLNSVQDKFKSRVDDLNKILKNDNKTTFNFLDVVIKQSEISNSISKLKSNKASGLDSVSNEMLKSGISTLLPCLHKLFNLVGFIQHPVPQGTFHRFLKQGIAGRQTIIEGSL